MQGNQNLEHELNLYVLLIGIYLWFILLYILCLYFQGTRSDGIIFVDLASIHFNINIILEKL